MWKVPFLSLLSPVTRLARYKGVQCKRVHILECLLHARLWLAYIGIP